MKRAHASRAAASKLERDRFDTAELDKDLVVDSFSAPPAAQRARWQRARRRTGRSGKGKAAEVISLSVERGLLERSDALAERLGLSRAAIVARGLEAVLAAEGEI
jgi:hypothetical protein